MFRIILISLWLVPGLVMANGRPSFKPKIDMEHRFLNKTGLEGSGGKFGFQADKLSVSNVFATVSYERWSLNWSDVDKLDFGDKQSDPIKQMETLALSGKYMKRLSDETLWLNTLGFSWTYEKQLGDAMSVNAVSILIRQLEDGWSVVYGGMVGYHPVQSRVLPVAGISYRMMSPLGWSGTLGFPRSYIGYGFDPKWQVSGGVVYNTVLAKLARESVVEANGFGEVKAWQADVALRYQPVNHWSVQTSLRYSPVYEFSTYNADGNRQDTFVMEPTWGAAVSLRYQF